MQNTFIERLNGPFRQAVLDVQLFEDISQISGLAEEWMKDYKRYRPQEEPGGIASEQCEKEFSTPA